MALEQLTEHEPVHVTWQVELPLHETLLLAPTVVVHSEFPVQSTLQESRQAPAQLSPRIAAPRSPKRRTMRRVRPSCTMMESRPTQARLQPIVVALQPNRNEAQNDHVAG